VQLLLSLPLTPLTFSYSRRRAERDYVIEEDFMKAVRKVADMKKLESPATYNKV
jgi:hypothetical protein